MQHIIDLVKRNSYADARALLLEMNAVDIALVLEKLPLEQSLILFRILPKDSAARVFSYMPIDQQKYVVGNITDREITSILADLRFDDTVDFLEEMPANFVKKVLKHADENTRRMLNQFLNYPENSAGSLMTIEFVDLKKEMSVKQALRRIKETGLDKETIDTCYVTDNERTLEGIVTIRRIILSDEDDLISTIMETNITFAHTLDDQEDVAAMFIKYDLFSMPVVDNENRLVGIITVDDILDIIEEEATEDFQLMAGISPVEEAYLKTNSFILAKHRIGWLLFLMISATFTANIVQRFEDVLQSSVLLAAFIPMLMDTGGNAGSQSSTLIIRGIALGQIDSQDVWKILLKEMVVGTIVGIVLAGTNLLRLYFISKAPLPVAITVSFSLFFTVLIAKVIGGILPIAARHFDVDPAIMASPLITTIVDAAALIVYFSIASSLLGL
ncbi:MAG TPA: magnesium transporter [bacterium]|jgi:magnesium transporter|nr:magnesium transporter [bacterium]